MGLKPHRKSGIKANSNDQDTQLMDVVGDFVRGKVKITAKRKAYIRLRFIPNGRELPRPIVRSSLKPLISTTDK